jgi:crotonobetainyl-CoA:carnitine CoA-transferase CaiB-like acyl-CoA transferase
VLVPDAGQHGFHALYRLYPCAEGWLFLAAVQPKEWDALTAAVDRPEWRTDDRYRDAGARLTNDEALIAALSHILQSRPAEEWEVFLNERGVPAAQAYAETFEEFLVRKTPHRPMTHPIFGDYWRRPPGIRIDGCETAEVAGAPSVGEHTVALLTELGYSADERDAIIASGAVKTTIGGDQ